MLHAPSPQRAFFAVIITRWCTSAVILTSCTEMCCTGRVWLCDNLLQSTEYQPQKILLHRLYLQSVWVYNMTFLIVPCRFLQRSVAPFFSTYTVYHCASVLDLLFQFPVKATFCTWSRQTKLSSNISCCINCTNAMSQGRSIDTTVFLFAQGTVDEWKSLYAQYNVQVNV